MKKLIITTIAATIASSTAFAQEAKENKENKPKGGMLAQMDSNGDGAVTKDEFVAEAGKRFVEMDGNKDGKVTEEEMKAHREAEKTKHEQRQKEMQAQQDKRFSQMDADGDGKITKEEMKKFQESMMGQGGENKESK